MSEQITEVSEAICEATPVAPPDKPARGKGWLSQAFQAEAAAEVERLADVAARS